MAFVASATGAAVFGLSGVAAGVAGGALLGAGAGALYSGITGDGNILNSALTGGLIGGGVGGLGAWGAGALGAEAAGAAGSAINPATGLAWEATGSGLAGNAPALAGSANNPALASAVMNANAAADPIAAMNASQGWTSVAPSTVESATSQLAAAKPMTEGLTNKEMLGYGLAGTAALSLLGGMNQSKIPTQPIGQNPGMIRPYTYSATQNQSAYPTGPQYGANGLPILPTSEQKYFNQSYTAGTPYKAANGGLMAVGGPVERMSQNVMGGSSNMFPQSQIEQTNFATPTQMPTSAEIIRSDYDAKVDPFTGVMTANMADGGITYDASTQTYKGLPQMGMPAQQAVEPLPADIIAQLTPQWQSANPNAFSYDSVNQRYGAGKPTMAQLVAMKNQQDQLAAQQAYQPFIDNSGGGAANGGLMSGYAMGGQTYNLGGYSDGGRLLKGPGDGVSDDIPAVIGDKQPARLADGEFVIPARIVSELGNGSTDAGAKRLYAMMDRIQSGRKKTVGKDKVAVDTKSNKHLPA